MNVMSERLRRERERRNHSQGAVAKATGMDQRTLSKWESGDVPAQLEWLGNLAKYYGVSVDYLLGVEPAGFSPDQRAAAELIDQIPSAKRASALAVLKAASELASVDFENSQPFGAREEGGVTFLSQDDQATQERLRAEKDAALALIDKMLPAPAAAEVRRLVEAGHVLTEADIARFLNAGGEKPFQQNLKTLNDRDAVGSW